MKLKINLKNKKIKNTKIFLILFILICFTSNTVNAADINSVLALISAPIAGFSLPENFIAQARAYLLSHPDIDFDALETKLSNARGVVQAAIAGKEINSLSDIVKSVSPEQKNAVIAGLQTVAKEAEVSVAVDNIANLSTDNKEVVTAVDKKNGAPIFTTESIIKSTGRTPNLSLRFLKTSFFVVLSSIEIIFVLIFKNKFNKSKNLKSI